MRLRLIGVLLIIAVFNINAEAGNGLYALRAEVSATLPQADEIAEYQLDIYSVATDDDSLSICDYIVTWRYGNGISTIQEGVTAYCDGVLYRYSDSVLKKEPITDNVERVSTAQFASFIPQFIEKDIRDLKTDVMCRGYAVSDTLVGGDFCRVHILEYGSAEDLWRQYVYVVNIDKNYPIYYRCRNNPGELSEYGTVVYFTPISQLFPGGINLSLLNVFFPEVFKE